MIDESCPVKSGIREIYSEFSFVLLSFGLREIYEVLDGLCEDIFINLPCAIVFA